MAGLIYIVATITLALGTRASRRVALVAIIIELVGVVSIGTLSVVDPAAFPRATVWSVQDRVRVRSAGAADSRAGLAVVHQTPLIWAFAHRAWNPPPPSSLAEEERLCSSSVRRRAISDAHAVNP